MGALIIKQYDWVFESVQFALDLRAGRHRIGLTQLQVAELMENKTGSIVSQLEAANYDATVSMGDFLFLCNLLDLHASDYFEIEPRRLT